MATEYGIKGSWGSVWGFSREQAEHEARAAQGLVVIAREVSEPRIVSIRA